MRNWRRTSFTIMRAARLTALMVRLENIHGRAAPNSMPTKTMGDETRMPVSTNVCAYGRASPAALANSLAATCTLVTSVRKEPKSATAAMTAEPMAIPLVMALVVLPTASRSAIILRAFGSIPAISPMPLALSEMGPKESIDTLLPVSVNMPMPVRATP